MAQRPNDNDVHPMELTVQSLLEMPLETLNLNLQSLHESQKILHAILYKMENTLLDTASNLRPNLYPPVEPGDVATIREEEGGEEERERDVDLNDYLKRIIALRKKVSLIEKILDNVETKVNNIEAMTTDRT